VHYHNCLRHFDVVALDKTRQQAVDEIMPQRGYGDRFSLSTETLKGGTSTPEGTQIEDDEWIDTRTSRRT